MKGAAADLRLPGGEGQEADHDLVTGAEEADLEAVLVIADGAADLGLDAAAGAEAVTAAGGPGPAAEAAAAPVVAAGADPAAGAAPAAGIDAAGADLVAEAGAETERARVVLVANQSHGNLMKMTMRKTSRDPDPSHQGGPDPNRQHAPSQSHQEQSLSPSRQIGLSPSLLPAPALHQKAVLALQIKRRKSKQMETMVETREKIPWKLRKMVMIEDQAVKVGIKILCLSCSNLWHPRMIKPVEFIKKLFTCGMYKCVDILLHCT